MQIIKKYLNTFILFFLLTITFLTIVPLFHEGYFPIHDDVQIVRIQQMVKALSDGQFPVRWVEDLGYGYGYPLFNFYAPLPYYIGSLFSYFGFSFLASTKIMMGIGLVLGSISMFALGKKIWGVWGGLVSAVAFQFAPYHAVQLFVRGAVGELYAYGFLPFIVYGIVSIFTEKTTSKKGMIVGVIGIAGVLLSHNITSLLVMLMLGISSIVCFALYCKIMKDIWFKGIKIVLMIFFALGISSFFWLPALAEKNYTSVNEITQGGSDYHQHFLYLDQLWDSPWGFGGSTIGRADGMSYKTGKLHILLSLFGVIAVLRGLKNIKTKKNKLRYFIVFVFIVSLIFSVFMTTEWSKVIWELVPILSYVQFPWRFLVFIMFFIAILSGGISVIAQRDKLNGMIGILASVLLVVVNLKYFVPQVYSRYENSLIEQNGYINWEKSKISDEYLPSSLIRPGSIDEVPINKIELIAGNLLNQEIRSNQYVFSVDILDRSEVTINSAYFPGWKVFDDNQEIIPDISNGLMAFPLDSGKHTVTVRFTNTPVRMIANSISVISLLLFFGTIFIRKDTYEIKNKC